MSGSVGHAKTRDGVQDGVMAQPTQIVTKALPFIMKQLPKLLPLLLDSKNRDLLVKYAKDLADRSPGRRLAANLALTAELASSMSERAQTPEEKARAEGWLRRASALRDRYALPVMDGKRAHRASLESDLKALHAEMSHVLRGVE